jgi:hypothetical protein
MMIHQDSSDHEWIAGQCWDLIVTMDDATSEYYSMFFIEEEGTASSFQGCGNHRETRAVQFLLQRPGQPLLDDCEAGGKVDKNNLTQFGRACKHLGIEMIAAYSPEARGRSERVFGHASRALAAGAAPGMKVK